MGAREHGGLVGEHDSETGRPLPAPISARAEDVAPLVEGIISAEHGAAAGLDLLIAAAVVAF